MVNLAQENVIKVGVVSHPSLLELPKDLEKLFDMSQAPLLINSCDIDEQFPAESCAFADKLLGEGKYTPGYKRVHWEGCTHGFAVSHSVTWHVPKKILISIICLGERGSGQYHSSFDHRRTVTDPFSEQSQSQGWEGRIIFGDGQMDENIFVNFYATRVMIFR